MDFADGFTFVLKLMPLIRATLHTKRHQWNFTFAVEIIREVVLIPHGDANHRSSVCNVESCLLIPCGFLATTVDCFSLEFLTVKLEDCERILVSE